MSPEAVLVHDLDKFDMIFQAYEYETGKNRERERGGRETVTRGRCRLFILFFIIDQGRKGELQQFFDSTKGINQLIDF